MCCCCWRVVLENLEKRINLCVFCPKLGLLTDWVVKTPLWFCCSIKSVFRQRLEEKLILLATKQFQFCVFVVGLVFANSQHKRETRRTFRFRGETQIEIVICCLQLALKQIEAEKSVFFSEQVCFFFAFVVKGQIDFVWKIAQRRPTLSHKEPPCHLAFLLLHLAWVGLTRNANSTQYTVAFVPLFRSFHNTNVTWPPTIRKVLSNGLKKAFTHWRLDDRPPCPVKLPLLVPWERESDFREVYVGLTLEHGRIQKSIRKSQEITQRTHSWRNALNSLTRDVL